MSWPLFVESAYLGCKKAFRAAGRHLLFSAAIAGIPISGTVLAIAVSRPDHSLSGAGVEFAGIIFEISIVVLLVDRLIAHRESRRWELLTAEIEREAARFISHAEHGAGHVWGAFRHIERENINDAATWAAWLDGVIREFEKRNIYVDVTAEGIEGFRGIGPFTEETTWNLRHARSVRQTWQELGALIKEGLIAKTDIDRAFVTYQIASNLLRISLTAADFRAADEVAHSDWSREALSKLMSWNWISAKGRGNYLFAPFQEMQHAILESTK